MVDSDAITRAEFRAAHEAVQRDIDRLDRQMNGNGQAGVLQMVSEIHAYVENQRGKEEGAEKARIEAIRVSEENERKSARARSLARWVAGGVATCLFAVLGWSLVHLWNWIEPPAAAIIQEYYQNHPHAVRHSFNEDPPQPTAYRTEQKAGGSETPNH